MDLVSVCQRGPCRTTAGCCRTTPRPEPARFFSVALDELLSMSTAEVDYLDELPPEEQAEWFALWRSVREVAK